MSKIAGSGKLSMCPMDAYISNMPKTHESASGSRFVKKSPLSPCARFCAPVCAPVGTLVFCPSVFSALQPKPAFCTFEIIMPSFTFEASKTIRILFVVKLTSLSNTPSILRVTRSTAAEQAAHDIPSIINSFCVFFKFIQPRFSL